MTPVIYEDGPSPLLAAMFIGWHGLVAFVGFWYLTRRWLLARRTKLLAAVSAGVGVLWGVWAMTASAADQLQIAADLDLATDLLTPGEFAMYAVGVGLVLAVSHWLIGYVWPTEWKPTKGSTIAVILVSLGYMAVAVIIAVPWAPLKLAVLLGGTYWLMNRRRASRANEPTIFDQLSGTVRLRDTAVLLFLPVAAAATYGATWAANLPESMLGALYWALLGAQVIGGAVAYILSARRALQRTQAPVPESTEG